MTKKINKLKNINKMELKADRPRYLVTIKDLDKNEILYQVESFAGVVSTMETTPDIVRETNSKGQDDIAVIAVAQKVAWGHPMMALWCLDQLKEAIRPRLAEIREFVQRTMKDNPKEKSTKNGN